MKYVLLVTYLFLSQSAFADVTRSIKCVSQFTTLVLQFEISDSSNVRVTNAHLVKNSGKPLFHSDQVSIATEFTGKTSISGSDGKNVSFMLKSWPEAIIPLINGSQTWPAPAEFSLSNQNKELDKSDATCTVIDKTSPASASSGDVLSPRQQVGSAR